MEITEQNITPKSPTAEPEDGIVVTDSFVAVTDGSTSKSPLRIDSSVSNGRLCMLLTAEYVRQARPGASAAEFCDGLTRHIARRYEGLDTARLAAHPEERLTASCAVYSSARREIWLVGDCQCLVNGTLYDNPKPGEAAMAEKRAAIARRMILDGEATEESLRRNDRARKAIIPDLIAAMSGQNVTYAVADGFTIPMDKVRVIPLTAARHHVVLATDGYPFLRPTLAASEELLAVQLAADPLNIRDFKATKAFIEGNNSFDDRAYIAFTVEPL